MRIISINTFNIGSTGKIMLQIADMARQNGIEYLTCCPRARDNYRKKNLDHQIYIGNRFLRNVHGLFSRIFGLEGLFSFVSTLVFLAKLKKIQPDIIHLHNIHGSYINFPLLFSFIKRNNIYVVWTLHDCWSFTGRCPHFSMLKCERWKEQCCHCMYPSSEYPASYFDSSYLNYKVKKKCFTGVKRMVIVTPSDWLANLVRQSYLKEYPVRVINNGIDTTVFKPLVSDFRKNYNISDTEKIVLGVAFGWDKRKGIDVFMKLSLILDRRYRIVLVGTNESIDQRLPHNIISIHRTENQVQLAEIYSAADVFVNPTREDNYPTVNMEAIACGTPVITFRTGGSPEIVKKGCGSVVEINDIEGLKNEIVRITSSEQAQYRKSCLATSKDFDFNSRIREYLKIYDQISK